MNSTSLAQLCCDLDLTGQVIRPFYGLAWHLRPIKARLLGRRESAHFHLITLEKGQRTASPR